MKKLQNRWSYFIIIMWIESDNKLIREFKFNDFEEAISFINKVAEFLKEIIIILKFIIFTIQLNFHCVLMIKAQL